MNQNLINLLLDRTDGPVNKFTVISRAMQLSFECKHDLDELTNALSDALDYIGEYTLSSNEFSNASAL